MKVSVRKLIYDFNRKSNAAVSGSSPQYQIIDIIEYLNEALETWFENRVRLRETDTEVRNALRVFEVKDRKLSVENFENTVSRIKYPADYFTKLNLLVYCEEPKCCKGVIKEIEPQIIQSDDLHTSRKDTYQKSSFKWERLLADEAGDYLYLHHDGECLAEKASISYIRKPQRVEAPQLCADAYVDYDDKLITEDVDLEVDDTFDANIITDIAVLFSTRDSGTAQDFNSQIQKIINKRNF